LALCQLASGDTGDSEPLYFVGGRAHTHAAQQREARRTNVLILGTADWDAPIATNQHYVARELAQAARVEFVESLGLRRPTLSRADMVRMAARVHRAFDSRSPRTQRPKPEGLRIVSPLVVPIHRAATQAVNQALLRRAASVWARSPRPRVLWTFTPVTYGLEAGADVVVYHCVDLLGTFPGVDAKAVARGEQRLSQRVTMAIATSTAVQEHLRAAGFQRVILLPNVADVSVFSRASRRARDRRPAALFSGNLSPHKLDVAMLESVAAMIRGRAELLLAGPVGAGGGSFGPALERLQALGAKYLGVLTLEQLADVAGECTIGLIPYALNEYTRGVSPLKCFEYLASGLVVLSTRLPEVERLARSNPHVIALSSDELPNEVLARLQPADDSVIDSRIGSAMSNGWGDRGRVVRDLLTSEVARARS
jgi:teichuronic acid biosynthesis glycosyltransferase TuaH